jgi:hypothetical protein
MKPETAATIFVIVIIIACFVVLGLQTGWFKDIPTYTENITIKDTYPVGTNSYNYVIVSTNETEYLTRSYDIYDFTKKNVGQEVNIIYVEGDKGECLVTDMNRVINQSRQCNVTTCGVPVKGGK